MFKKSLKGVQASIFQEAQDAIKADGRQPSYMPAGMEIEVPSRTGVRGDTEGVGTGISTGAVGKRKGTGTGTEGTVSKELYGKVKAELDLKKEELKMVLRRIEEEEAAEAAKRVKAASSIVSRMKKVPRYYPL